MRSPPVGAGRVACRSDGPHFQDVRHSDESGAAATPRTVSGGCSCFMTVPSRVRQVNLSFWHAVQPPSDTTHHLRRGGTGDAAGQFSEASVSTAATPPARVEVANLPSHHSTATPALQALEAGSVPYRVLAYEHDPRAESFGHEAVRKLGLDATAVCKTLMTEVDGRPVTAVVPIASQLRLRSLAGALGAKQARMLDPATAQRVTGYVVGGISPLGQRRAHPCVVDASVMDLPLVYVSAGRRGLTIELAPADLIRTLNAQTAAITTT